MADTSVLDVRLHGAVIGTITFIGDERTLFAFEEDYLEQVDRPVLGLNFKNALGTLLTDFRPVRTRLMPFFSNLLPEGYLRQYLARRAGIHVAREFFLLGALGKDLPGAVTITSAEGDYRPAGSHQGPVGGAVAAAEEVLRFSLAGMQLKFSAVAGTDARLTIPASGAGGDWIVKLPAREYAQVPENEFSMMRLAGMVGIDVPEFHLINIDSIDNLPDSISGSGDQAFMIRRFDRNADGSATHIEDFAQVFGVYPEDKYRKASFVNLAAVIDAETDHMDIAELIRRLTFNVLIGNGDMHLKNWSLIYPDRRRARLAPAYDFVSTIPYIPGDRSALTFSQTKDFTGYTVKELTHLAGRAALPQKLVIDTAAETVALFMDCWDSEKNHLPMGRNVIDAIDRHLTTLPILTGSPSGAD